MINLTEIFKPKTLEEALTLLRRPGAAALAGGSGLLAGGRDDIHAVVDLSGLGLAYVREENGQVAIGAMTTLEGMAGSQVLRSRANGIVAQAAHRSAASVLRNQSTLAGTMIVEPTGILATALVALDAEVRTVPAASRAVLLTDFLGSGAAAGTIVTEILIPAASLLRRTALETVARTPRDKPIVTACAAVEFQDGKVGASAIALGGVAATAVRAPAAEKRLAGQAADDASIEAAARAAQEGLKPPSDHLGSDEYRLQMVRVLVRRALRAAASVTG
ncbi:MAG: FAD binding domain-containing protein [Rudaea sp.]